MNEVPVVRQFVLCDYVAPDPDNPRKINAFGLTVRVRSLDGRFPTLCEQLSTYLALSNGRGRGVGQVVAVRVETGEVCWATAPQPIDFGTNPLAIHAFSFRMRNCVFPAPGPYAIEFRYNGVAIADQTLIVGGDVP
jgi:hypothetical protein